MPVRARSRTSSLPDTWRRRRTAGRSAAQLFEYAIFAAASSLRSRRDRRRWSRSSPAGIDGEPLSIYDPGSDARHALNGFLLKNTTGLHLAGGPVTVFQGGIYAGDAQITNLQPKEDRLLSYAVDLDLVVGHETPKFHQETLSVAAKSGVLLITRKQQREQPYTFRNKAAAGKTVLVQQAIEPEFKLIEPAKPAEKTASEYRFRVAGAGAGDGGAQGGDGAAGVGGSGAAGRGPERRCHCVGAERAGARSPCGRR